MDPFGWVMAGSSILGSLLGSDAAESASQVQAGAADRSAATQERMFNTINNQQLPYRQAGEAALADIRGGLGIGPQHITSSGYFSKQFGPRDLATNLAPNYQWQLDQGLGAVKNAGNLHNGLYSGNTLRGINDYAQNFAGNAYQNAFQNFTGQQTNIFNRLSAIAGLGQTANQTSATAGTAAGQGIGAAQMAGGAAQAAGIVGGTNAITGGINNAASWYSLPGILKGMQ
jgi:hypothetical protein